MRVMIDVARTTLPEALPIAIAQEAGPIRGKGGQVGDGRRATRYRFVQPRRRHTTRRTS
jgi:hypothetical protein